MRRNGILFIPDPTMPAKTDGLSPWKAYFCSLLVRAIPQGYQYFLISTRFGSLLSKGNHFVIYILQNDIYIYHTYCYYILELYFFFILSIKLYIQFYNQL